jgi:hypothetical protein
MNAPPNIDPGTGYSDNDVVHWLTNDTGDERFIDNIFAELCVRLQRADIPVKRASLHLLIYHPQWLGARIMWAEGMAPPEFVERVIFGPSKFPAGIYDAFIVLLADVGIPNPAEKIIFSDVPLRQ